MPRPIPRRRVASRREFDFMLGSVRKMGTAVNLKARVGWGKWAQGVVADDQGDGAF